MKKITLLILIVFTINVKSQTKLLSSIDQYLDGSNWINSWGHNYDYDGNNNLVAETDLEWINGAWKNRSKTTYVYDGNNKVTEKLGQDWNATTNMFENSYKDNYTYSNGKLVGQESKVWENSSWVNEWKVELTYNGNNLPESALFYNWDGTQWELDSRETLVYNVNNKMTENLTENWENSQWVNSYKTLITYNGSNKIIATRGADWDKFNNLWVEVDKMDYVIDVAGNRTSEINEYSGSKSKEEYEYDTASLMDNFAHPFKDKTGVEYLFEDFPYVNKLLQSSYYWFDSVLNNFTLSSRTIYNYSSAITLSTEQSEMPTVSISIYPNPTTSTIQLSVPEQISVDSVSIIDGTGKVVLVQSENTASINVEKLPVGIYFVEMFAGQQKFASKFVKE
ncbi:T9SS type A sorting domain-containing protein [Flavobacterium sp. UMI-01]|uniref:T9SS type A sorting domain-containing protein n=1 Tax=Flavobacterium sp. UMI-01 TaxID=1441053 RepID=UPI001C7CA32F|nr:T9SS type A sorting domain-containing protein [Flavobacterium sp. UMI-01]GIZ07345.1 hypothetical protein FUMI01_00720 [Flavobacterium sp. UMI-01]